MRWEYSTARIPLLLVILVVLGFGGLWTAYAADTSGPYNAESAPPEVGSVNEYMEVSGEVVVARYVPLLGIYVFEDRGKLSSGQQISGLSVMSVDRPGPADDAGIRAEHVRVFRAATKVGLGVPLVGATLFFRPAIMGLPLITHLDNSKAYDVIVAVDAERTRNISEVKKSLRDAKAGQTIYLTIVRDGRREQLQLRAPTIVDFHSATSQPMLPE